MPRQALQTEPRVCLVLKRELELAVLFPVTKQIHHNLSTTLHGLSGIMDSDRSVGMTLSPCVLVLIVCPFVLNATDCYTLSAAIRTS